MGGTAAKERRRLKRLAEQQKLKGEGARSPGNQAASKPSGGGSNTGKKTNDVKQNSAKYTKQFKVVKTSINKYNDKKRTAPQLQNYNDKKTKGSNFQNNKSPTTTHKGKKQFDKGKSKKKIPVKAKKVKKPKHLAKKIKNATDPEVLKNLLKQKEDLDKNKSKRKDKFKMKVIEVVGGEKFFNAKLFEELMEQGGGKFDRIVEAVKIGSDAKNNGEENVTDSEEVPIGVASGATKKVEGNDADKKSISKEKGVTEKASASKDIKLKSEEEEEIIKEDEPKDKVPTRNNKNQKENDNNSSSISDSDSDDEVDLTIDSGRTRGRRRRGRQEADAKREEQNEIQKQSKIEDGDNEDQVNKNINDNSKSTNEESPTFKDTRRCIGRKPLTDFKIGKKYTGTVVYVKPKLGLFIDINCHSDAFCHISRCSDTYVEAITDDAYKVGDVLTDRVRIVNVDRKKKRLTASLQSDEKIVDEEKSNESWLKRQQEKKEKKIQKGYKMSRVGGTMESYNNEVDTNKQNTIVLDRKGGTSESRSSEYNGDRANNEEVPIVIDEENMTPAELKRARKLQRRAERRRQKEETGIAA